MEARKNYYYVLGIEQTASDEMIKLAYRELAKKYHPDIFNGDKSYAEFKMKEINEAYSVLSDNDMRDEYDCVRSFDQTQNKEYDEYNENERGKADCDDLFSNIKRFRINSTTKKVLIILLKIILIVMSIFIAFAIYEPAGAVILFITIIAYTKNRRFLRFICIAVFVFVSIINGFFNPLLEKFSDHAPVDNSPSVQEISQDVQHEEMTETNYVITEYLLWQYKYANENGIPINHYTEQQALSDWIEKANSDNSVEVVFLETDNLFSNKRYIVTDDDYPEYQYWGELSNQRPDGYGMLLQSFDGVALLVAYIGEFEDGRPDGYGLKFSTDIMETRTGGGVAQFFASEEEMQDFFKVWLNYVEYEGMFKEGKEIGDGNGFVNFAYEKLVDHASRYGNTSIDYADIGYDFLIGKYKNGMLNGKGKIYHEGLLLYEGGFSDNEFNGNGIAFYPNTTQIQYEGKFTRGAYDGFGTMYNEDGSVSYEGEWEYGNPSY